MSDDYTTQGGTDWELRQAENELIAAGDDPTARALAQRRHAEAIRNMMQSALVPSFEKAVSTLIDKSAAAVITEVHISIEQMTALVQQVLIASRENARGLKKLQGEVTAQGKRLDHSESDRTQLNARLSRIEQLLESRPAQREIEHKAILDAIAQERGE